MKKDDSNRRTITSMDMRDQLEPLLYQVVMYNDDFTPKEFVIALLERFFNIKRENAISLMMEAHTEGCVVCGHYSYDVASTKVQEINDYSRMYEHPLICHTVGC